ncbi:uncharacterized protein DUF4846 [Tenacibaculum skagerrakense]|uniref:Uncharacterized protein DUF4846 n=1 Tax=Tenacibaculum skagerrakense TaxID=186571 RepID=A0A4R2P221_9FLAO|nr:DUF4846 domain-containing protein [Tenacibaculum skagerrakense]TCP28652.1 uncharacterized protein DUF4846 [Tenacibaculum skagerrakense]
MRKSIILIASILSVFFLIRTNSKGKQITNHLKGIVKNTISKPSYINESGDSISTRVRVPEGFKRVTYPQGSFEEYLRNYKLKKYGTPIINFDGSEYFAQHWHDAILEIPVPKNGLQQCADALMRIRAEYLWNKNLQHKIGFKFTSGHYCSWKQYAEGYRPKINGSKVKFLKTTNANYSKSNFYNYLNLIFTYAGTASLHAELPKVKIKDLKIGDMLIQPGFPGHIEIIADEIMNDKGEKMYLLVQGNTPAQNVCLLKNFEDIDISPWYRFAENEPVYTPSYYFDKPVFIRFK